MQLLFFALASLASNAMAANQFTYNGTTYNATSMLNQTAHISVVMPINNATYAPQDTFPLVIAADNYAGMLALQPKLYWTLCNVTAATERDAGLDYGGRAYEVKDLIASAYGDRRFWVEGIRRHTSKEGLYRLSVSLHYNNCSVGAYCDGQPCERDADGRLFHFSSDNYMLPDTYFTAAKNAKRDLESSPSLVEQPAKCATFNVTEYVPLPAGLVIWPRPLLPYCVVLSGKTPKLNACNFSVDENDMRRVNETIYTDECRQFGRVAHCSSAVEALRLGIMAWTAIVGALFCILLLCY